MIAIPSHASPADFPLAQDSALVVIALGMLVFTIIAYDMYHYYQS